MFFRDPPQHSCAGTDGAHDGDGLVCRIGQAVRGDDGQSGVSQNLMAQVDVRAGQPHHHRDLDVELLERRHDALGNPVTAVDAGEDVDQHRLDLGVVQHRTKRLENPLW